MNIAKGYKNCHTGFPSFTFTFTSIQRVNTGLFYKSNSIRVMDRWFINNTMEQSIVPPCVTLVDQVCSKRQFLYKFICCLANMAAHHTSRNINTIVCACQVLVEWEGFIFCLVLWNSSECVFVVFSMATTK